MMMMKGNHTCYWYNRSPLNLLMYSNKAYNEAYGSPRRNQKKPPPAGRLVPLSAPPHTFTPPSRGAGTAAGPRRACVIAARWR